MLNGILALRKYFIQRAAFSQCNCLVVAGALAIILSSSKTSDACSISEALAAGAMPTFGRETWLKLLGTFTSCGARPMLRRDSEKDSRQPPKSREVGTQLHGTQVDGTLGLDKTCSRFLFGMLAPCLAYHNVAEPKRSMKLRFTDVGDDGSRLLLLIQHVQESWVIDAEEVQTWWLRSCLRRCLGPAVKEVLIIRALHTNGALVGLGGHIGRLCRVALVSHQVKQSAPGHW